jgi:nucleotidyltransferase substrate binding protein (TIGR01987 family)
MVDATDLKSVGTSDCGGSSPPVPTNQAREMAMIDVSSLERAIAELQESLAYTKSDLARNDAGIAKQFRAASIQAFEFTYELAHKMLKRYLEETEPSRTIIESMSFAELIRTGAERGLLLHSFDRWRLYRHSRSVTSHTYNEEKAQDVFEQLESFLEEVVYLCDSLKKRQAA